MVTLYLNLQMTYAQIQKTHQLGLNYVENTINVLSYNSVLEKSETVFDKAATLQLSPKHFSYSWNLGSSCMASPVVLGDLFNYR